jgi:hypothetical protein
VSLSLLFFFVSSFFSSFPSLFPLPSSPSFSFFLSFLSSSGVVGCAKPNPYVYAFDSKMWLEPSNDHFFPSQSPISLDANQLLQQTTSLRNTDWIYGIAVYTGNETKFGKNKGIPPLKLTKMDHYINYVSIGIFCFQIALTICFGVIGETRRRTEGRVCLLALLFLSCCFPFVSVPFSFLLSVVVCILLISPLLLLSVLLLSLPLLSFFPIRIFSTWIILKKKKSTNPLSFLFVSFSSTRP